MPLTSTATSDLGTATGAWSWPLASPVEAGHTHPPAHGLGASSVTPSPLVTAPPGFGASSGDAASGGCPAACGSAREARGVPAVDQHLSVIEGQPVIVGEDHRDLAAFEAKVDRARQVGDGRHHLGGLGGVRHVHDGHAGERAHQCDILDGLVAGAAGAGNAGHEADDADRQVRVGDCVNDLVEGAPGREYAERVHERDQAAAGERPGHADHVRLGHASVDEAVRERRLEEIDLALTGQVAAQADDLRALPGQFDQRVTVRLEDGAVGRFQHGRFRHGPVPGVIAWWASSALSSASAAAARSTGSLMKWPSASGGRQASPWRVEVRQTRTWGRSGLAASARRSSIPSAPPPASVCPVGQGRGHGVHVVAVELDGIPAERTPFGGHGLDGGDAGHRAIDLGIVGIEQDGQPAQAVVPREHRCLPDLPFLQLAVAEEGERPGLRVTAQAIGQRETGRRGQALAQRAAGVVRYRAALGADGFQRRAVLPVGRQHGLIEQAGPGGGGVCRDDVVRWRADHPVGSRPQGGAVDGGVLFRRRQRLAEVAEPVPGDHPDRVQPDRRGQSSQIAAAGCRGPCRSQPDHLFW